MSFCLLSNVLLTGDLYVWGNGIKVGAANMRGQEPDCLQATGKYCLLGGLSLILCFRIEVR